MNATYYQYESTNAASACNVYVEFHFLSHTGTCFVSVGTQVTSLCRTALVLWSVTLPKMCYRVLGCLHILKCSVYPYLHHAKFGALALLNFAKCFQYLLDYTRLNLKLSAGSFVPLEGLRSSTIGMFYYFLTMRPHVFLTLPIPNIMTTKKFNFECTLSCLQLSNIIGTCFQAICEKFTCVLEPFWSH